MYLIDKSNNRINKIEQTTFKKEGFTERKHLQEWIANNPDCLQEPLLIIQKEFNGFSETNERLDLLALDKDGNLVIIENKLDDTGRDVMWQVIKYASYCSTLTYSEIVVIFQRYLDDHSINENATDVIEEFLDLNRDIVINSDNSQRIFMVAGEYRKEVTSSVLWLLNNGIRIQCFKATPFRLGEQLLLNMDLIIPIKESEQFVISMAKKSLEKKGIQEVNKENSMDRKIFWVAYLNEINKVTDLYKNVSAGNSAWIGAGCGHSSLSMNSVVTGKYAKIELYFNSGEKDYNKQLFDFLHSMKEVIENDFGKKLEWERMDDKVTCRIKCQLNGVSVFKNEKHKTMIDFLCQTVPRFHKAFEEPILKLKSQLP
jgi:Domain of unknown function (DUF4268)